MQWTHAVDSCHGSGLWVRALGMERIASIPQTPDDLKSRSGEKLMNGGALKVSQLIENYNLCVIT